VQPDHARVRFVVLEKSDISIPVRDVQFIQVPSITLTLLTSNTGNAVKLLHPFHVFNNVDALPILILGKDVRLTQSLHVLVKSVQNGVYRFGNVLRLVQPVHVLFNEFTREIVISGKLSNEVQYDHVPFNMCAFVKFNNGNAVRLVQPFHVSVKSSLIYVVMLDGNVFNDLQFIQVLL
jgi:hypothetical protein